MAESMEKYKQKAKVKTRSIHQANTILLSPLTYFHTSPAAPNAHCL